MSIQGAVLDSDAQIKELLESVKVIAVVGASANPQKPAGYVFHYLAGLPDPYRVYAVNPFQTEISGLRCYPTLQDLPEPPDLIDVFRPAPDCPPVAQQAVAVSASALWLQSGIISSEAADIATAAGLTVVMDRCLMVEHRSLL